MFYNRGYIAYDRPERFVDSIGHAVSTDLIHRDIKPPVLTSEKGGHDDYQVWSPGIIKHDGAYWMFYTNCQFGVTFYATSDNPLHGWTEHEQIIPRVSCSEVLEFKGKWYIFRL